MKKLVFIMALFISGYGMAQEFKSHQSTSAPDTARFEIVQSELTAKNTFKLDKYTGDTYILYQSGNKKDGFYHYWELINKDVQLVDLKRPNKVNYQIFSSGMAAKYTFLLNVNTGVSWQLALRKGGSYTWQAMDF